MWKVRQEQVDAFRQNATQKFEDKMVKELKRFFPKSTARLGESGLRDVIRHGIKRSRGYGIVRACDVGRYITVMMMFGPRFDERLPSGPLYATLRDPRFSSAAARTDALCRAALGALRSRTLKTGRKPNW
jgi:hypothetical protein